MLYGMHISSRSLLLARLLLLVSFTSLSSTLHAGLYKGLDADGNVTYSDKPFDNAEKITPPPITVVDAPKAKPEEKNKVDEEKPEQTKYTALRITSPTDQQTIWNEPQLNVAVDVQPSLNTSQGHKLWLFMDGKALVKNSSSPILQIGRADRGAHKIQVQVRGKKGKILRRSKTITIYIKNTVVPRASPR